MTSSHSLSELPPASFNQLFSTFIDPQTVGGINCQFGKRQRKSPKIGTFELIMGLVFHSLCPRGPFSSHIRDLTGKKISDAALSMRRRGLAWKIFERILEIVLCVRADPQKHSGAFYKGLRLVGIDGTRFSLSNAPAIVRKIKKAVSRRFEAAFAQLGVCMIVELGIHNPLAIVIACKEQSEISLAQALIRKIPASSLLLADRLYGAGVFLVELLKIFAQQQSYFLVRVPKTPNLQKIQRLADGSVLGEAGGRKQRFVVRQIYGVVHRRQGGRTYIRLWTSLLDHQKYPANELLKLYAQRWEQELAFKELKIDLKKDDLLASQTPETAMQEIAALVIAQAILVQVRIQSAHLHSTEVLRISFTQVLDHVQMMWKIMSRTQGIMTPDQEKIWVKRVFDSVGQAILPPRRQRSCPREVRKPVGSWPRLTRNRSFTGEIRCEVIRKNHV